MAKERFNDEMSKVLELEREIKKKKTEIMIKCSHQKENGKLKIYPLNEKGDYKCKKCGEEFNMNSIARSEIEDAIETIHNAIQQIRSFARPEEDFKLIRDLGALDFNLRETGELYDRVVNLYGKGKKNKNKNHDRDDFGLSGHNALNFIGSKRK